MGKALISKEQRDLLQQHSANDISAVHYDRYDYMKEKRSAIKQWTEFLEENVILKKKT